MHKKRAPISLHFVNPQSLVCLLLISFSKSLFSQNTDLDQILASDGAAGDKFGWDVSLSEDFLVVGSRADTSGAVYVYSKDIDGNWVNEQKLSMPTPGIYDYFGASVSIAGNTIVVGCEFDDELLDDAGAAYVYEVDANGQWNFKQKLMATNPSLSGHFGDVVFNTTDYIVVNASSSSPNNMHDKSVYVFEKNQNGNWYNTQKIDPDIDPNALWNTSFGNSISLYGDYLAIGEISYSVIGPNRGAVHIYKKNGSGTWEHDNLILASDGADQDYFGRSVSIFENTIVVGIDGNGLDSGAIYAYDLDGNGNWGNEQKFLPSDNTEETTFGYSVQIHGDRFIASALGFPYASLGAAYLYRRLANSEWVIEDIYMAFDPSLDDRFGWAVSIFDDEVAIGAPFRNGINNNEGAVYVKSINCGFSLECPEDMLIETNANTCEGLISFEGAELIQEISGGRGDISINQISGPVNGEILEVGNYEVSFEANNIEGLSDNCTFSLEVKDHEAPTALCQDLAFVLNPCEEIYLQAEDIDFGSSDACGIASYNLSQTVFDESFIGVNPVDLTVTDIHGNTASCEATVTIESAIQIDAPELINPENMTITYGEPLELIPSIANTDELIFFWYVNGTLFCADCYNISIYPESNLDIELIVQDTEGCLSYSDEVSINLMVDYAIHIPNAFSPNHDGVNDHFQAYFSDGVQRAYELQVRDRWGNIVFNQKGENIAWDGNFRGQKAINGVYNYTLVLSLVNGTEIIKTGTVCLMR
jgi:gliding motility-associated-like protein